MSIRIPRVSTSTVKHLLLASAACLPILSAPLVAQAEETATVEEVVITARHREENLQKVPAAVSAIGGDFLAASNTTGIAQVSQLLPSVQFQTINPRNSQINIRGLGNNIGLANDGLDPGVGFYVDGVYYNRPAAATFDLIDLARVETLAGPQGTLYGKNTTAGAISVTTASPSFTPGLSAELSAGNYGYIQAKGSITGPLTDTLAARLSVSSTKRDGFQTNRFDGSDINDYDNLTVRAQALYTPSDTFSLRVIGDFNRQQMHCCAGEVSGLWTPPSGANFTTTAAKFGYVPKIGEVDVDAPVRAHQESGGVSAQADWTLSGAVVTSITAWRYWNWSPRSDTFQTPLDDFNRSQVIDRQKQFTQELRIASTGDNTVDYIAGLYYFRETVDAYALTRYGSAAVATILSPALPALILNGVGVEAVNAYKTDSYAAFGQATWHLSDKLNLTGGLRYTSDRKKGSYAGVASGGLPLAGPLVAFAPLRAAFASSGSFNVKSNKGAWGGHLDLAYDINDDVMTYVSYSRGNRSGGLNLVQLPPGASAIVAPETVDAYEVGLKTRLFDRRLTLNAAAFMETDKDYQGQTFDPVLLRLFLANIKEVSSKGIEVSAQLRPSQYVSAYGSATYNEAAYEDFKNSPCPTEQPLPAPAFCNISGISLPGVPRWAAAFGFEVHKPVTMGAGQAELYFGLDDAYRSTVNSAATASRYSALPSRNLVNARLGLREAESRWDAYIWSKNLGDVDYKTAETAVPAGYLLAFKGDPRTYGITLRMRR